MEYPFVKCLHPQRIVNKYTGEQLVVPCGRCSACGQNKSARLAFQCECECSVHKYNYLVTLTYANTFIPRLRAVPVREGSVPGTLVYSLYDVTPPRSSSDNCMIYLGDVQYDADLCNELRKKCRLFGDIPYLRKRDLQLFIKLLRSYLPEYEIRYFACGEYGVDRFRPHFHLLLSTDYSEICEASQYCCMGEFPKWTWPKKKKVLPTEIDRISFLEYFIRKAWKFGIVDCSLIASGSASSYVASYVNGSQSLPPFLKIPATKCFSVHSRFLGREVFRKEFTSVLSTPVEDFVKGILDIGRKPRFYTLSYSNYRYYYPRCKGYANTDSSGRLQLYQAYDKARQLYPSCGSSLMRLAHKVTDVLYMYFYLQSSNNCVDLGLTFYQCFSNDEINLANLLLPFNSLLKEDVFLKSSLQKLVLRIYSQLSVSRIFCENVSSFRLSPKWYLRKIEDFYSTLDYLHLKEQFESMSMYFDSDFADEGDLVYFYNNTDYDFDEFKNSLAYKVYACDVKKRARDSVKHKLQNERNGLFDNDLDT